MNLLRKVVTSALALSLALPGCASDSGAQKPAEHPSAAAGKAPPAATAGDATTAVPAAKPTICDVGNTEAEVSEEILARSGRGLLWLVAPDRSTDPKAAIAKGADEVRGARVLADCLLKHWDASFDPTQSQGFEPFEKWVDAHLGPEHAETLLAASAAYFASLLVAESWIDAALDVPAARLFLERANAANPRLADGLGPLILGAYLCFVPKAGGGDPAGGLKRLQEAWSHEGSLQLSMKVAAAELCTPVLRDQRLFGKLLDEVEKAPISGSAFDVIAKQRAKTLREEEEDMFPPL